jgi:hypothetical protein
VLRDATEDKTGVTQKRTCTRQARARARDSQRCVQGHGTIALLQRRSQRPAASALLQHMHVHATRT